MVAPQDRRGGIVTATVVVAGVTAASRLSGFLREAVIAAVYGASVEYDAYLVALGVPNVVIALVSTAAITPAIPVLSGALGQGRTRDAHGTFDTVSTVILAVLVPASLVMAVVAEPLVAVLAPGFPPEQAELTVRLARMLLSATVFVAAMNLVSALLHAHQRFFWPAVVGIPFNAVMIVAALWFGRRYGVTALAVAFVLGSLVRVVVQFPGLRGTGYRFRPRMQLRHGDVRAVAGLVPVVVVSHVVANVNTLVDRIVGSTLAIGTISALNYGYRLMTLPHGLLTMALVQVLYPSLSRSLAREDDRDFADLLGRGLGTLVVVLTPVAIATVVLARPLVESPHAQIPAGGGPIRPSGARTR